MHGAPPVYLPMQRLAKKTKELIQSRSELHKGNGYRCFAQRNAGLPGGCGLHAKARQR